MPKYVEVGQDIVEFPDDMTDEQIAQALSTQAGGAPSASAMPAPAPTQQQPTTASPSTWEQLGRQIGLTARAGITGAASIPMLFAEPVAALTNLAAGRQVFPSQQQALQQLLTDVGLPAPQTGLERAVQTGASSMASVAPQAALAQASGIPALAPLAKELPQQLAAAGAAGTTAQAVSERAEEVGFSPVANAAATLATGTLAGMLGAGGARMMSADKVQPVTIDQVKREASRAYTRVDNSGITVKPLPVLKAIDDIEASLIRDSNFNPQLDTHRPVKVVLDQMRQMVGSERVSFTKMDQLRQAAADLTRSNDAATRRLAGQVVSAIDKKITSLQPNELITGKGNLETALKDVRSAREAWRRVSKATILEDALNIAEARALTPNASEGELIRTQFKQLAANKDKMRLFNKDEQEAIRRVVSGKGSEKVLALLARFNPERSQLMTGLTIGAGFQNPLAAGGVAATGFAADKALALIQRKAAQDVMSRILSGQIARPRDTTAWRALVEAQAQQYSPSEQAQIIGQPQ